MFTNLKRFEWVARTYLFVDGLQTHPKKEEDEFQRPHFMNACDFSPEVALRRPCKWLLNLGL